eukprot:3265047-Amphidinium_carterae.1
MVQHLRPFFQRGSYDIIYKNCNHFSDCALYFLTSSRLDSTYNRAERWMLSTDPLSTGLMNQMFKSYMTWATGKDFDGVVYITNQQAEDFDSDDVIEYIDGIASEETRGAMLRESTDSGHSETDSEAAVVEEEDDDFEAGCWDMQRRDRGRRGHC